MYMKGIIVFDNCDSRQMLLMIDFGSCNEVFLSFVDKTRVNNPSNYCWSSLGGIYNALERFTGLRLFVFFFSSKSIVILVRYKKTNNTISW